MTTYKHYVFNEHSKYSNNEKNANQQIGADFWNGIVYGDAS